MADRRTLDTVMTIAARFGGKTINLLVFLIVARHLSLSDMGVYGIVFSMSYILSTMLDFGVRNSLAFFIGKEPGAHSAYARQAFLLWIAMAVLAPPVMLASLYASALSLADPSLNWAVSLLIIAMLYLRMMQGELLGTGDMALFNKTELASRVVLIVLTLGFLLIGRITLTTALWTLALSQAGAALYLFLRQIPLIRAGRSAGQGLAWALFSRGVIFMLSVVLMNASKRLAVLAIGQFADTEAAGTFFALQRLTEIITEVGLAVSVVLFSHSIRAASGEEAAQQAAHSTRIALAVFSVIALVLGVTASWSVPLMLGDKFAGHTTLFILILLATLAGSVWTMVYPSLSVMTSPMTVFLLFIPGLTANVLLIGPLMNGFGLHGAAIALLVANLIISLSFLLVFRQRFGVPTRSFVALEREDVMPLVNKVMRRWHKA